MRATRRSLPAAPRRDAATLARPRRTIPLRGASPAASGTSGTGTWIYPAPPASAPAVDSATAAPAQPAPRWRDEAVAAVSHDLRNPLNSISLAAELLQRAWPSDPALLPERGLLDAILTSTEQMRRMVMDLLDQSRLDAGGIPVAAQPVELGPILRAAADSQRLVAQQRGVTLAVIDAVPCPVLADDARIDQVLGNLLGNALAHTPEGGRVTIAAERAGDQVRVSVSDTGPGIPADVLPHVFDRFFRGAEGHHGAGLGLSIARAIVEAHGGRIHAESTPGHGATFVFTLPLA
ncbi:MAG TPA: HAMP domain-containing sensor histidine kinase [Longimicrobium sp.]|nr:HAMP domain-containing sensor histidine kinase [Longimicrobium sp.]